jgi:signal transduction histidine kinase
MAAGEVAVVDDLADRLDRRSDRLARVGPPVLLVVGSATSAATASFVRMSPTEVVAAAVLVAVLLAAHVLLVLRRWSRTGPDDTASQVYAVGRTAGLAVLCVLNPFFSLSAFIGYFDAGRYLHRRAGTAVVVVTAVTMAGAQSGGLPPVNGMQAGLFGVLLLLNVGLGLFFARMEVEQDRLTEQRVATIDELERVNRRLADALAENERLHDELLRRARESGRHEERERLALEIHDTIAQSLMGVVTQLEAARTDVHADADAATRRLVAAGDLARDALGEARRSVEGLLPEALDGSDLVDALKRTVDEWSTRTGTAAEAVVTGTVRPVPAEVDSAVLRVAGEALRNVEQHAGASRVGVTLSFMAGELALDVRDDGRGAAGAAPGRFGITGMRRRAERLGGELVVESAPGAGTAVMLRVPVRRG